MRGEAAYTKRTKIPLVAGLVDNHMIKKENIYCWLSGTRWCPQRALALKKSAKIVQSTSWRSCHGARAPISDSSAVGLPRCGTSVGQGIGPEGGFDRGLIAGQIEIGILAQ